MDPYTITPLLIVISLPLVALVFTNKRYFRLEPWIQINRPVSEVWDAFLEPMNTVRWQDSLVSVETITGEDGQVGSSARLVYRDGGRRLEMTETVLEREERAILALDISRPCAVMQVVNRFEPLSSGHTVWTQEVQFTFRGWARLIAKLYIPSIVTETEADMARFKELLEAGEYV